VQLLRSSDPQPSKCDRRTAETHDEFAPSHSITSSAPQRSNGEISSPAHIPKMLVQQATH